ncbi:MAG TPA: phosphoenolpyruvate synthase [Patescibacteria group bacterium]
MHKDILWFKEISKHDVGIVGGKGANLGEMVRAKFPVPDGFVVTSQAYFNFLRENQLMAKIKALLATVNYDRPESLAQVSIHIKKLIMHAKMSEKLIVEIEKAYRKLGGIFKNTLVAVRSSATAEDLPTASFAGQQETFLNVQGEANLILKIKAGWASLFEPRAIFYRHEQKFDHFRVGIAIVVEKMIEAEQSGVMFTIDPVTNDKTKIVIEAILGLGELIVQGKLTPDHYEVSKKDFQILHRTIAHQEKMLKKIKQENKEVKLPEKVGKHQKIADKHIIELAKLGNKLEKHYFFPQDIEWAIAKNQIYLVQTRAITTIKTTQAKKETSITNKLQLLLKGAPASPGIGSGAVKIIKNIADINKIVRGDVLVATQTNPDYVTAMKKAAAIITDKGGRTSHAAIVSRELGIPAVVGTEKATSLLQPGSIVTVDGAKGEIYKGAAITNNVNHSLASQETVKTATKIYVNLAQPEMAEKIAQEAVDGVGLLRAEFIMAAIGVHPMKLIKDGKKQLFINTLAEQLAIFCKAFQARPVVYRASDFKTNEYRGLKGGSEFEPEEPNPMLGFRGAFRYIHNPEVFKLELEALKIVRNKMGYKNLWMMVPFVRTVKELVEVKHLLVEAGLERSTTFKLWLMVEIPSNVILLEDFIKVGIDGISIGSNDLTMLILGTDRDNSDVASEFDELDPAVLWALEKIIKTAHKYSISVSICGQAPSVYPALTDKLVQWGISSISVSPDAIATTRKTVAQAEKKLIMQRA